MIVKTLTTLISLWLFFGIVLPFIIFPNYMIKPKIKKGKEIEKVSKKIRSKNKEATIKNAYDFLIGHYESSKGIGNLRYLGQLFKYNVEDMLKKRQFLWCHSQNLVLKTLLIKTGQFDEEDVKIRWRIRKTLTIHQFIVADGYKIDPFYRIFTKIQS